MEQTKETAPTVLTKTPSVFTKTDSFKVTCGLEDGFSTRIKHIRYQVYFTIYSKAKNTVVLRGRA